MCACAIALQVPRDHEEIARLEGRYKNQGGLKEGMVVELANGASAIVVGLSDEAVRIDANNMMAGKTRTFEVMLLDIGARAAMTACMRGVLTVTL